MVTVSVAACPEYELNLIRQALTACLEPLGGIRAFVRPGMSVLLKPNLLGVARREQAVTTHPLVVQAVAELVRQAGGTVMIGDSPAGPTSSNQQVWKSAGMVEAAEASGSTLVLFESVEWKARGGQNYFIARPALSADLVINLPKLKTHSLTLYSGAVKNMFGVIPGTRKGEVHVRAPGVHDFSLELVNLLELVRPGLTIMDGVIGLEGNGPGASGTPHHYGCLAASTDPVALDSIMTQAMGFGPGQVLHLAQAGARGLGVSDPGKIHLAGDCEVLAFGRLKLPAARWYLRVPSWLSLPVRGLIAVKPRVDAAQCSGCGKCAQVCPAKAITTGRPVTIRIDTCIGCLCCAEVCPQGAVEAHRSPVARMFGLAE